MKKSRVDGLVFTILLRATLILLVACGSWNLGKVSTKEPITTTVPGERLAYRKLDDGTYEVSGIGTCTDTTLVIPDTYEGKAVTSIGDWAFSSCSSLAAVTFITTEGWKADGTALSATDLADAETAAKYLTNKYRSDDWTRN